MQSPTSEILILGCERSGSTWLLNIIDSVSNTECYLEPFADYAAIFPGFPHRLKYLGDVNKYQVEWVNKGIKELVKKKYGFLYNHGSNKIIKSLDSQYIQFLKLLNGISRQGISKKIEQYELLNLNKGNFLKSASELPRFVIKELRLNLKINLIQALFPNSKIIVSIRNPVLQIESILNLFSRNRLSELKRSLIFLETYLKDDRRFQKYRDLIKDFSNKRLVDQLTLYWLINYNTLMEDLERNNMNFIIANIDKISVSPEREIKDILNFCELEISQRTSRYIKESSQTKGVLSNPINTNRESKKYYHDKLKNVDKILKEQVLEMTDKSYVNPMIMGVFYFDNMIKFNP